MRIAVRPNTVDNCRLIEAYYSRRLDIAVVDIERIVGCIGRSCLLMNIGLGLLRLVVVDCS